MKIKRYEFGVRHDSGTLKIRTAASSLEAAKNIVMQAEGCPEGAITSWRIIPTARQLKKTKSLMRGL